MNTPQVKRRFSKSGFTLVELLVVIAIIAVLISILLPALNKVRRAADSIVCMSHLRQIGVAALLYSNNYRGVVLPCQLVPPGDYWDEYLVHLGYLPAPRSNGGPPFDSGSIFICPNAADSLVSNASSSSAVVDGSYSYTAGSYSCSYGINGSNGNMNNPSFQPQPSLAAYRAGFPPHKMSRIRFPAQMALIYDGLWYLPANNPLYRIAGRHGNRDYSRPGKTGVVNILFLDGHVASVNRSDIFQTFIDFYVPSTLNSTYPLVQWRVDQSDQ